MGRSASHITLEVGFKTQPNIVLIGEEILAKKMTLAKIIDDMAAVIARRGAKGQNYGVVLVPEGLIEFIPQMRELISALNDLLAAHEAPLAALRGAEEKKEFIIAKLPAHLAALMRSLPPGIATQLMSERDPHGNVMVSLIETEKLLIEMLHHKIALLRKEGRFKGKFSTISHFFGYEGRCGAPSNFDANYTYALGATAAALALNKCSGYIASVKNLTQDASRWQCGGAPLTMMMNMEKRKGKEKPVIKKALVDLNGRAFKELAAKRAAWAEEDHYIFPGPVQYFGPKSLTDMTTRTLSYELSARRHCEERSDAAISCRKRK
jgi:pyrophosphate--fructose-6-phosphate 1-phosphotransferase